MPDKVSYVVEHLVAEEMDIFSAVSGGYTRAKSESILVLHSPGGLKLDPM